VHTFPENILNSFVLILFLRRSCKTSKRALVIFGEFRKQLYSFLGNFKQLFQI